MPSRTRSKNEEVVVNSTQEKMTTFRIIRVCVCVCVCFGKGGGQAYLDFDRDRDLDSECLETRDGLGERDLLSDLTRAGLPRSDLDGERDPYCHSSMLTTFTHSKFIYLYKSQ